MKGNIINDNRLLVSRTLKPMVVLPIRQEERELKALINEKDFVMARLLINDLADPVLTKQKKI
ncbi:hypothetical protein GCM10028819_11220 [Spirosoma humi]